jgi:hypothetical protein
MQNRPQLLRAVLRAVLVPRPKPEKATAMRWERLLPGYNHRDQKIPPVSIAAMVTGRANQLHGNPGINRLHDGLVEAVQIIGNHANDSLLVCIHRGSLFLSPFFYT